MSTPEEYRDRDLLESATEADDAPYTVDAQTQDAMKNVLRTVFARHTRFQPIRREHLNQAISTLGPTPRGYVDELTKFVNVDLDEIFGCKLMEVPVTNKKKSTAVYGLVSSLDDKGRRTLQKLYQDKNMMNVDNQRNTNDDEFYLPRYVKTDTPLSNHELIKMGVMSLVLSLVIISENHISDDELGKVLKTFGISSNASHTIPNLGVSLEEFLTDLSKKDYLQITDKKYFSLGTRAIMEFSPLSMLTFIEHIYGDDFDIDTRNRTVCTLQRCYENEEAAQIPELNEPQNQDQDQDQNQDQNQDHHRDHSQDQVEPQVDPQVEPQNENLRVNRRKRRRH